MDDSAINKMDPSALRGVLLRQPPLSTLQIQPIASFQGREIVYVLPNDAKDSHRAAFFAQLILRGRALAGHPSDWRAWTLTTIAAGFSNIVTGIVEQQPALYEKRTISSGHLATLQEMFDCLRAWTTVDGTDATENQAAKDAVRGCILHLDDLPPIDDDDLKKELGECMSIEAIYGYLALIMILAAKFITDQNRVAITVNRPRNIEQKYRIVGCPCLTGDLRISDDGHTMINAAFVSMDHFRGALFTRLADMRNQAGDRGTAVVMTLVRLLDWTGMSFVPIIDRFLSAHPDISDYSFLLPSYQHFLSSLRALAKVPPHIRPFYKLIHGDTTKMFHRRDVEELLVCSIKEEAYGRPTMAQYTLPATADKIWEMYLRTKKALHDAMDNDNASVV